MFSSWKYLSKSLNPALVLCTVSLHHQNGMDATNAIKPTKIIVRFYPKIQLQDCRCSSLPLSCSLICSLDKSLLKQVCFRRSREPSPSPAKPGAVRHWNSHYLFSAERRFKNTSLANQLLTSPPNRIWTPTSYSSLA